MTRERVESRRPRGQLELGTESPPEGSLCSLCTSALYFLLYISFSVQQELLNLTFSHYLYFQIRVSRRMLLIGLLGSGNWMNYLWAEEQGYLIQTWQLMPHPHRREKSL